MYITIMLGSLRVYIRFTHPVYVRYIWNVYETVVSINERSSSSFINNKMKQKNDFLLTVGYVTTVFRNIAQGENQQELADDNTSKLHQGGLVEYVQVYGWVRPVNKQMSEGRPQRRQDYWFEYQFHYWYVVFWVVDACYFKWSISMKQWI